MRDIYYHRRDIYYHRSGIYWRKEKRMEKKNSQLTLPSRSNGLGTGTLQLAMDCATGEDGSMGCTLNSGLNFTTQGAPAHQDPGTSCAESYQSWQLEGWSRKYELAPGSPSDPPRSDTGPSFTLRNMANTDIFDCSSSGNEENTFVGTCAAAGEEGASASMAEFTFDRSLNMLTVTQHWECDDA